MMRFFLLNPTRAYELSSVVSFCSGKKRKVEKELLAFEKAGLVKRRRFFKELKQKRVSVHGWTLNASFIYLTQLRNILVNSVTMRSRDIVKRLKKSGGVKLVVLAGIFIQNWESRVDILVVGDKLERGYLLRALRSMETDVGRELHYSILDTADFQYRMSIGDKLVRDIFDYPHQVVLNSGVLDSK